MTYNISPFLLEVYLHDFKNTLAHINVAFEKPVWKTVDISHTLLLWFAKIAQIYYRMLEDKICSTAWAKPKQSAKGKNQN